MERRFLACLAALVLVAALVDGAAGVAELALYSLPFVSLTALLLRGRFVGEHRIVQRWRRAVPVRAARARNRWPAAPATPFRTRLDRFVRVERGPPAHAAS